MNAGPFPSDYWLIVIAASLGGHQALKVILSGIRPDIPAALIIVQHRVPSALPDGFRTLLDRDTELPVVMAEQDQRIEPGVIYVARSDLHLTVTRWRRFRYVDGTRIHHLVSSADPLFASAARVFKEHLLAVVLTGSGLDAAAGAHSVKEHGGVVIAQHPATAESWEMPAAAMRTGAVDLVLPPEGIAPVLEAIVRGEPLGSRVPI